MIVHNQGSSSQQQQQPNNSHASHPSSHNLPHSLPAPPHPPLSSQPHPSLPSHPSLSSIQPTYAASSASGYGTSNGQGMHYTSRGLYAEGLPLQRHDSRQYSGGAHPVALPPSLQSSSSLSSGQSSYLVNQPKTEFHTTCLVIVILTKVQNNAALRVTLIDTPQTATLLT